jgi:hypothetical protein
MENLAYQWNLFHHERSRCGRHMTPIFFPRPEQDANGEWHGEPMELSSSSATTEPKANEIGGTVPQLRDEV